MRQARTIPAQPQPAVARVQHWMSGDPVAVRDDASVLKALDLMVKRGLHRLPVLDRERRVVGVLSVEDLRGAFPWDLSFERPLGPAERSKLLDRRVDELMTWSPLTVEPGTPLEQAASCLSEQRVGCLPVVDGNGRLVGFFSEVDALRALRALIEGKAPRTTRVRGMRALVEELRAQRQRLVRELARWQGAERALSADIREEPRDAADRGSDEDEVARIGLFCDGAARQLRAVEAALERADRGRFGICERCESRIRASRLRTVPETALCARCARAGPQVASA